MEIGSTFQTISIIGVCIGLLLNPVQAAPQDDMERLLTLSFDQLMDVEITTASKFSQRLHDSPSVVSVITANQIKSFGANNLYEVLDRVVSFYMTESFFFPQNVASIRGNLHSHADNHVLLMLNGHPIRESYSGGVNFPIYSAFPLKAIEKIEIIRGPGSVLYGTNAMSAVINVITHSAEQPNYFAYTTGEHQSNQIEAGVSGQSGENEWTIALSWQEESGWPFALTDQNGVASEMSRGEQNLSALIDWRRGGFRWQTMLVDSEQDFMGASASWSGPIDIADRQMHGKRMYSNIQYDWEMKEGEQLLTSLSFGHMTFDHYNYKAMSDDFTFETSYQKQLTDSLYWVTGGMIWYQEVGSEGNLRPAPVPKFDALWSEAYTQFTYRASEQLSITAGVQINKPDKVKLGVIPRLAVNYAIDNHWALKLAYGEAYRAAFGVETNFDLVLKNPDGTNRGGLRGNPNLAPETSRYKEASIKYQSESLTGELVYFSNEQQDLIGRVRAADRVLDFVNLNQRHAKGVELSASHHINENLSISASYTQHSNHDGQGTSGINLVPEHMMKVGVIYNSSNSALSAGLFNIYRSKAQDNVIRNATRQAINPEADSHHLLTAHVSCNLNEALNIKSGLRANLNLYVYNVLNEDIYQPEFVGLNINTIPARAERSAYVSLSLNW